MDLKIIFKPYHKINMEITRNEKKATVTAFPTAKGTGYTDTMNSIYRYNEQYIQIKLKEIVSSVETKSIFNERTTT